MNAALLRGKPAISLAEASKLGYVADLHVEPTGLRVVALRIGSHGYAAMIPFGEIQSIGADAIDAIMVPSNQSSRADGTNGSYGSLPDLERLRKLKVADEAGAYSA
ncbi:MAG: hypothetical protein HY329_01690 [Chloroflexi bacterium]|nr:hypothetical protein [Chloroflexota bacterium]